MEKAMQIELSERLLAYNAQGTQALAEAPFRNDVSAYTDRTRLAREQELLFRQTPLFMGISRQIPKPGDYLTNHLTGVPILVIRGDDGEAKAFLNVCRHRGAKLLEGCGKGKRRFSCPYHGWTYDTSGALVNILEEKKFGSVDKATLGLTPLPVEEKYGLIFVRPTPGEPVDIDKQLGGLAPEMAAFGFDSYVHYRTTEMSYNFNWKIVQDTFLETYHLPVLHKTTVSPLVDERVSTFDAYDLNLRMVAARRGYEKLADQKPEERDLLPYTAIIYLMFPNTTFIWQGDHAEAWCAYPDGDNPDRTNITFSLYAPSEPVDDSERRHWDNNFDIALATVEQEDFPLSEKLHAGFYSGAQNEIIYGRNEPSLIHYHKSLRKALGINR